MSMHEKIAAARAAIDSHTLEETFLEAAASFPFRSDCTDLTEYAGKEYPWHWHNEAEILRIVSGKLQFITTSQSLELHTGDIVFLSGGMLHCTRVCGEAPAVHKEFIFSPLLIAGQPGSDIDRKYVSPVLHAGSEPIVLRNGTEKNREITPLLDQAYSCYRNGTDGYELRIRSLMDRVWIALREEIIDKYPDKHRARPGEERLKSILLFLQNNYGTDISVADMASVGNISERECSRCFKKHLGITPMEYLLNLRLEKACELLGSTGLSIGEIASACGFSSASYFAKKFREQYRVSPRIYRSKAS